MSCKLILLFVSRFYENCIIVSVLHFKLNLIYFGLKIKIRDVNSALSNNSSVIEKEFVSQMPHCKETYYSSIRKGTGVWD